MAIVPEQLTLVTPESAGAALVDVGLVDAGTDVRAEPLSGGISNIVLAVEWDGGRAVLKQSLPRLRVATEWEFDQARIINERRCLEHLGRLLPPGSVPEVLAYDDDRFLFVMSHAPDGGSVWKDELLAGRVNLVTAQRAGTLLGLVHNWTVDDPIAAELFADQGPLVQGRVDPYHRTAAARNPDVAAIVLAEVERLMATRRTLVLGDWSPKNLLVYPDRVLALDFEVAHLGDPAFDVAFLLTHLVLKAVHVPAARTALRDAADAFLHGYREAARGAAPAEADVVAELGCLLLARVDGKSRAEYLTATEAARVHALAHDVLRDLRRPLGPTLDHLIAT